MELHAVTFERLEKDLGLGSIRSIEVDHARRVLQVITDQTPAETTEGQSIRQTGHHSVEGSYIE